MIRCMKKKESFFKSIGYYANEIHIPVAFILIMHSEIKFLVYYAKINIIILIIIMLLLYKD